MESNPKQLSIPTNLIPTASAVVNNQQVELLYDPVAKQTAFAVWKDGGCEITKEMQTGDGRVLVPFSPQNNLIQNGVILLPSHPEEYGTEQQLLENIQTFIHRYVDVSPLFEKIACYYVIFSWVYDQFNELPYIRLRGEPGSGKTRFLQTVGSLCYKPIFASGASTISPLFRILDTFHGTLIIDESDFRQSDERAEVVKILNNGNVRGFPVLRSEANISTKEFNPRAYAVFGPKIVATRGQFDDRALESRFLTEDMHYDRLRRDIPINLPLVYQEEALRLRNQLLLFRFRNFRKCAIDPDLVDRNIAPRFNQIFVPLLSVIKDSQSQQDIQQIARTYHQDMLSERSQAAEAHILEIIRDLMEPEASILVKDIASHFEERHQDDFERKITPRWIGYLLRSKLRLKPIRTHGIFVLPPSELLALPQLLERYGLSPIRHPQVHQEAGFCLSEPPPQDPMSPQRLPAD